MPKTCKNCNQKIPKNSQRRKFCSDICNNRFHSRKSYHKNKVLTPRISKHPKLNTGYFRDIDTKEKAYWFGFICADGRINNLGTQLTLHLAIRDEDQIDRFAKAVSADASEKKYYGPYETSGKSVMLYINNPEFVGHLVTKGCDKDKTSNLTLPTLENDSFNQAFLMGFYDGDGSTQGSSLSSSNKEFLLEIKAHYSIPSDPYQGTTAWKLYSSVHFL